MNKHLTVRPASPPPQKLFKALTTIEEQFALQADGSYEYDTLGWSYCDFCSQKVQIGMWLQPSGQC